jgi:hypothetical protein
LRAVPPLHYERARIQRKEMNMKSKSKRSLKLTRETLRTLQLRAVRGGELPTTVGDPSLLPCTKTVDTNTYKGDPY